MQVCRPGYDGNFADMQKSPDSRMHRLKFPMLELDSIETMEKLFVSKKDA